MNFNRSRDEKGLVVLDLGLLAIIAITAVLFALHGPIAGLGFFVIAYAVAALTIKALSNNKHVETQEV